MKRDMGPLLALYPMPVTIVGSMVDGRPNYATVAHVGILNYSSPQFISVGLSKSHLTNEGIRKNKAFSVCIPSEDQVVETDYVGMVSGKKSDKSKVFKHFTKSLPDAPLIDECPVCMECRLYETLDMKTHEIFIGELVGTYCDESILTDGAIDQSKVRPMLFDMGSKQYWGLGAPMGKAWSSGKKMMK